MDSIRQAIDMSRTGTARSTVVDAGIEAVPLSAAHLESTRIVAHFAASPHGRYFDMLRTQVLQEMDKNGWQFLAVTSATAGCGKTVTACNLAMSITRMPERSVLLVDFDLHKPRVAEYLGFDRVDGGLSVLEGRATLPDTLVEACIGPNRLLVLPGEVCKLGASEWMASQSMSALLQTIKREFRSHIVIFDLPPLLVGDDVISILPQMDAVLLIAGAGNSSVADIKECQKHLKRTPVVRVVVNRVMEMPDGYHAYY